MFWTKISICQDSYRNSPKKEISAMKKDLISKSLDFNSMKRFTFNFETVKWEISTNCDFFYLHSILAWFLTDFVSRVVFLMALFVHHTLLNPIFCLLDFQLDFLLYPHLLFFCLLHLWKIDLKHKLIPRKIWLVYRVGQNYK